MRNAVFAVGFVLLALSGCEGCLDILSQEPDKKKEAEEPLWVFEQPYPDVANLNGVWGATHDDVWAVGTKGTILHYDGETWSRVPTPTEHDLFDIDGREGAETAADDIYAVGASGVIIHWDGVVWNLEADPVQKPVVDLRLFAGPPVEDTLMGVWHGGSSGIYAVGENGTIVAKLRDPADPPNYLNWALQYGEMIQDRLPVCETRFMYDNGGQYPYDSGGGICTPCNMGQPRDENGNPIDVPIGYWPCTGDSSAPGYQAVPLCMGTDFNADIANGDCVLPASLTPGGGAPCVFGQRCEEDGTTPMYQITLHKVDLKAVVGYGSGADLRVVAVGESGAIMEMRPDDWGEWNCEGLGPAQRTDYCWRPVGRAGDTGNPAVRDTLAGVWGTWASSIYAVGEDGRLLRRDGDTDWLRGTDVTQSQGVREFLTTGTPIFLRDLWHQGHRDFFVVGFSGVILRHTGDGWSRESVPTNAHLRAIWGITRDDLDAGDRDAEAPALRTIFVVGSEGVILRRAIDR